MKGLEVVSCSWKNPEAAAAQVRDMLRFRDSSTAQTKQHFQGVVQTIWSGAGGFLDEFMDEKRPETKRLQAIPKRIVSGRCLRK
jgi:ketol-acid reductoisomerase